MQFLLCWRVHGPRLWSNSEHLPEASFVWSNCRVELYSVPSVHFNLTYVGGKNFNGHKRGSSRIVIQTVRVIQLKWNRFSNQESDADCYCERTFFTAMYIVPSHIYCHICFVGDKILSMCTLSQLSSLLYEMKRNEIALTLVIDPGNPKHDLPLLQMKSNITCPNLCYANASAF